MEGGGTRGGWGESESAPHGVLTAVGVPKGRESTSERERGGLSPSSLDPCVGSVCDGVCGLSCRYLGDGRFHLESIMIANPDLPAYR